MAAGASAGTYVLVQRPASTTEYRAVFKTPTDEGINGDTSPVVRVSVAAVCRGRRSGAGSHAPCL